MHIGWFCAAWSALTLLPAAAAFAAAPDPTLRRSDQLDVRRIGKLAEDERALLRVEWRAALSGEEEARSVQEMLDSLRRMEGTVAEISRLVRSISVQKPIAAQDPVVAAVAAAPPVSDSYDSRLLLANIAAGCLVALWWFRRRKPTNNPAAAPGTKQEIGAPVAAPVEVAPPIAPPVQIIPVAAPTVETPAIAAAAEAPKPTQLTPAAAPPSEAPRSAPSVAIKAEPVPPPVTMPKVEQTALPKLAEVEPSTPLPPAKAMTIDFSLEEADPETVARANAKAKKPRRNVYPDIPESTPETNVEPTLQLAEIMLSMGLEQGAAQALLEYTEANPRQAVYHWLKLLGIYRKRGQQAEFVETAEKLRKHFNVQAEDWVRADTGEAPTLEKFPRVAEQVQKIWGQPAECLSYLRNLLEDNRDGARAGFPQTVAEEILFLIEVLKETSGTRQTVGM